VARSEALLETIDFRRNLSAERLWRKDAVQESNEGRVFHAVTDNRSANDRNGWKQARQ
jgi:hypothetical protein